MQVTARFGVAVSDIRVRSRDGGRFLRDARDCDADRSLARRGQRLETGQGVSCLSYGVDLDRAAAAERRNANLARMTTVIVSPAVWLWRPAIDADTRIVVRFDLPPDVNVSVPWLPLEDRADSFRDPSLAPQCARTRRLRSLR